MTELTAENLDLCVGGITSQWLSRKATESAVAYALRTHPRSASEFYAARDKRWTEWEAMAQKHLNGPHRVAPAFVTR